MNDYNALIELDLGTKFTVFDGELVQDDDGALELSDRIEPDTVYLNKMTRSVSVIPSGSTLIGRQYKVRANDCVMLCARYLDSVYGSSLSAKLQKIPVRDYLDGYTFGYQTSKLLDWGFTAIDDPEANCVAVYKDSDSDTSGATHLCVLLGGGLIIRHHRKELSTYSDVSFLDRKSQVRFYRYGD